MPNLRKYLPLSFMLVLSSAISIILLIIRIQITDTFTYIFLLWNLFLAWVPFIIGVLVSLIKIKTPHKFSLVLWLLVLAWVLFFPNAPYIMTDLIHLKTLKGVPIWYDAILVFSFAWNGLMLGFLSLYLIQNLIRQKFNSKISWVFVFVMFALSGFGIYLGRFSGWNSWDIFVYPTSLFGDITDSVFNPFESRATIGITFVFSLFLGVAYLTLISFLKIKEENITTKIEK